MNVSVLKSDAFKTTDWSGGTTTEMYLHPKGTTYQERNFDFRLSMAKVLDQESVFTPLPGIRRKLMVLDGCITLIHEHQHKEQLAKFDVATFNGGWKTSCIGSCIDFNLMMMGNTRGNLEGFSIQENGVIERDITTGLEFVFAYNFSGKTNIRIANESQCLNEGDLMVIEGPKPEIIRLTGLKTSTVVWGSTFI